MSTSLEEFVQDDRRDQILAAARSEIVEEGYANAQVDPDRASTHSCASLRDTAAGHYGRA